MISDKRPFSQKVPWQSTYPPINLLWVYRSHGFTALDPQKRKSELWPIHSTRPWWRLLSSVKASLAMEDGLLSIEITLLSFIIFYHWKTFKCTSHPNLLHCYSKVAPQCPRWTTWSLLAGTHLKCGQSGELSVWLNLDRILMWKLLTLIWTS